MAGVRWEIMLFAVQAGLQESLLTKCLDKTCLQWLLGDIHNQSMAPCGFKISLLMQEFISFFRVLKLRRKKKPTSGLELTIQLLLSNDLVVCVCVSELKH